VYRLNKHNYVLISMIGQMISSDNRQFSVAKYNTGSTMCAFNNASEINTVGSRIECSSRCLQHGQMCNQFNTKVIQNSTKISCELFMSPPTVCGVSPQCHLHQVRCSLWTGYLVSVKFKNNYLGWLTFDYKAC